MISYHIIAHPIVSCYSSYLFKLCLIVPLITVSFSPHLLFNFRNHDNNKTDCIYHNDDNNNNKNNDSCMINIA